VRSRASRGEEPIDPIVPKIAAVGLAGIGAQWISWRFRLPAIVLLALAGLLLGPATGFVVPLRDFSGLFGPLIAVAVAIILFEGGLTLNFSEIRHTSTAVRRLCVIGAPLAWGLGALAAHYIGGLPWPPAAVLSGILVVTGPTVIMPLLRQARLAPRPASLLRWEAIVNDPVGALFAVLAYEAIITLQSGHSTEELAIRVAAALAISVGGGFLIGRAVVSAFNHGAVPEFLKSPVLLVTVLAAYAASQQVLEESGLLTVTVMGLTIGNSRLLSLAEIKRFKETMSVLLVSGVFVLLTATVDYKLISALDWRGVAFVAAMLFVVRPLTTWTATIGSGLTWQERTFIGWIAPRGIVAVAVTSFFAAKLTEVFISNGDQMKALAFALVMTTVVLHGFTIGPLARALGLASSRQSGVLFVGGNVWTVGLAQKLREIEIPVMIADSNWNHLRAAREADVPVFYGEILSEVAEHTVDLNSYGYLVAATDNDAYNTLVCTDFSHEIDRANVFQLHPPERSQAEAHVMSFTLGGHPLLSPEQTYPQLTTEARTGWQFRATKLTGQFNLEAMGAAHGGEFVPVLAAKPDGLLSFSTPGKPFEAEEGDTVISFGPALS
jgi:NhaP-type Na+/H+ or K+/H+ antiporter